MDSGFDDASPLVVTDHLGDHKPKEALAEAGIEVGLFGEPPESGDLDLLTVGISGRETSCSLVFADGLGDLETLREQQDQRCIDVVDAGSVGLELFVGHDRHGSRSIRGRKPRRPTRGPVVMEWAVQESNL